MDGYWLWTGTGRYGYVAVQYPYPTSLFIMPALYMHAVVPIMHYLVYVR